MPLPSPARVIYQRNPLLEVITQLRFPTILKIANQDPVEFQDAIRQNYPILEVSSLDEEEESPSDGHHPDPIYHFKSEDFQWEVLLNRDFLTLITNHYDRYEAFKERFSAVMKVFETIYKPAFYDRVGLRYKDLIIRSSLGLEDEAWSNLIPAYVAPELHSVEIADEIISSVKILAMNLGMGQVIFRHGLVEARKEEQGLIEPAYLLDADFFNEQRTAIGNHVWIHLDDYNQSARKLFRWSITEKLHQAMEPQPV